MKSKILVMGILAIVFVFTVSICVAAQNSNTGTVNQTQQQTQTSSQGEDSQIQKQNNEQVQSGNTDSGVQNQVQQQTQNTGAEQQIQTKQQMKEQAQTVNGEAYRNTVSNVVQGLLDVADNEKSGIGEQIRVVAQEQEKTREQVADQIESIQKRNKIKTFLIGTNYKNTGALRSEIVNVRNRIEQLNRLMEQTQNEGDKTVLQEQIQTMEQEQARINAFISVNENKFSLFGWLVKLFN